jgi:hypothetical protein
LFGFASRAKRRQRFHLQLAILTRVSYMQRINDDKSGRLRHDRAAVCAFRHLRLIARPKGLGCTGYWFPIASTQKRPPVEPAASGIIMQNHPVLTPARCGPTLAATRVARQTARKDRPLGFTRRELRRLVADMIG